MVWFDLVLFYLTIWMNLSPSGADFRPVARWGLLTSYLFCYIFSSFILPFFYWQGLFGPITRWGLFDACCQTWFSLSFFSYLSSPFFIFFSFFFHILGLLPGGTYLGPITRRGLFDTRRDFLLSFSLFFLLLFSILSFFYIWGLWLFWAFLGPFSRRGLWAFAHFALK